MKQVILPGAGWWLRLCIPCFLLVASLSADQVDMRNGDRYVGTVVSLSGENLVLQNEVLGTVKLPRAKVAVITFGSVPKVPPAGPATQTNLAAGATDLAARLNANTNLIARVQKQFLAGADPEAQAKFDELVSGLLSGKLTMEDLRVQARATAEQARAHRKDLGDSAGWMLDGYLAILDRFLAEDPGSEKAATNSPPRKTPLSELPEE